MLFFIREVWDFIYGCLFDFDLSTVETFFVWLLLLLNETWKYLKIFILTRKNTKLPGKFSYFLFYSVNIEVRYCFCFCFYPSIMTTCELIWLIKNHTCKSGKFRINCPLVFQRLNKLPSLSLWQFWSAFGKHLGNLF